MCEHLVWCIHVHGQNSIKRFASCCSFIDTHVGDRRVRTFPQGLGMSEHNKFDSYGGALFIVVINIW